MITRYDILQEAAATIGDRNSPEDMLRLGRLLNKVMTSMSERLSWMKLRRKMTIDLSDSSDTSGQEGVWLPGNLAGVDSVQDQSTGAHWIRRETDSIANVEYPMPRYSVYTPGLDPLFWSDDMRIPFGSSTFSSVQLDVDGSSYAGDYTGEWVRIGNEPVPFEITDERTIGQTYWGPDGSSGVDMTIRPRSQQKLVAWNDHDELNTSDTVTLFYWTYHPLLYRDSDEILFPYARLIELLMYKEAKGSLGRRSRDPLNNEIDDAWKEASRLNPDFYIPSSPLDRIGNSFDPSTVAYVQRGRDTRSGLNVENWR